MWLSLICTKVKSACPAPRGSAPKTRDDSTPPLTLQINPVPAQAMHSRNPRRSTPSSG
jgi:hypothetical protein